MLVTYQCNESHRLLTIRKVQLPALAMRADLSLVGSGEHRYWGFLPISRLVERSVLKGPAHYGKIHEHTEYESME